MRAAVLSFGFQTLQAELAISGAFSTNLGSIRVSEKIGYLPNGVRRDKARDRAVEALLFRLPRERWETMGTIEVEIEGFGGCERLFGLGRETRER
jgi:RimJ/RimL family protein N-acetyltransferase